MTSLPAKGSLLTRFAAHTLQWRVMTILDALNRIANRGESLARVEAREVMKAVLEGNCADSQIAALLIALRMKGETVEEIVGFR